MCWFPEKLFIRWWSTMCIFTRFTSLVHAALNTDHWVLRDPHISYIPSNNCTLRTLSAGQAKAWTQMICLTRYPTSNCDCSSQYASAVSYWKTFGRRPQDATVPSWSGCWSRHQFSPVPNYTSTSFVFSFNDSNFRRLVRRFDSRTYQWWHLYIFSARSQFRRGIQLNGTWWTLILCRAFGNINSRIRNPTLQIDVFEKLLLMVVLWSLQFATTSGQTAQFLSICTIANARPRVPGLEQLTSY